jgi:hypothetical protein
MDVRHVFRRGNHLIARAARNRPDEPVAFICECSSDGCFENVIMKPSEFESVAAAPARFVVLDGHEERDVDEVVGDGPGYTVVEGWSDRSSDERREVNAG